MGLNILVTGGAGYIGSTLVPELLAAGHKVTVVDNFLFRQNSLASVCYHPNFEIINGDVRDERVISPLLKKIDAVIPLAALVGAPMCAKDPVAATTVNKEACVRMFQMLGRD